MGEALARAEGGKSGGWDFVDGTIGQDRKFCVGQGICHVHQRLREVTEELG